ncbi:hypothetical protein [Thalassovita sp.]|uniref:MORN repeat-containing protein n=1 Tax=Thalassovita sp. TaxID=1979401 RepID=UPI002882A73E|nr:hypothetical protein [Thalassovita sp.]MDF1804575.1 hypothetical protein [Thalassovita sp.]
MAVRVKGFVLGIVAGIITATGTWADSPAPVLQEKLHVIYDPVSREVTRRVVRVFDPHPEMGLEFIWEPAAGNWPGVTPEGLASGAGKLGWRVPGTANYDPRAMHHTYEGTLKDGRFHGAGMLSYRDGAFYRGTWVAGVMQGDGEHLDAAGNRYEGPFRDGRAEGQGVYRAARGWVYAGTFKNGLRDGPGQITEPGGLSYQVVMQAGEELSSDRPLAYADNRLGGLLPAQSGGMAGKMDMTVTVDPRLRNSQSVPYTHYAQNGEVLILPSQETWRAAWNGAPAMGEFYTYSELGEYDWPSARAHTLFRLETADGSRARLKSLDLAVDYSLPHLRPILTTQVHQGCTGFRPSFQFQNFGWGQVENATAKVGFRRPDDVKWEQRLTAPPKTAWFELPVGDFDLGADVYVRNALIEAGVDVTRLENRRLTCPSADMLDGCRAKFIKELGLTGLAADEGAWGSLYTDLIGELSYDWVDALGERHHEKQVFNETIFLGMIEVPGGLAECGAGGAYAMQAPQYTDVDLPYDGQDYRINLPVRGNPNISSLLSGLKFYSERSSMHLMQMEATFADGSVRKSAPVRLFFMRPRTTLFETKTTPAVCTLPANAISSC